MWQNAGGLNVLKEDMPAYQAAQGTTPTAQPFNWASLGPLGAQWLQMANRPGPQMPQMPQLGGGGGPIAGGWSAGAQPRMPFGMRQQMQMPQMQMPGQGGLFGYLGGY